MIGITTKLRGAAAAAIGLAISAGAMFAGAPLALAAGAATGSTASDGIALSNSYAGNTWRQQMLKTWDAASKQAIDKHIIAKAKVVNSNNSAPEQASQIQNLILEGWNAIVIDAASPTALNGVIQQACRAQVTVVVFDSLATAPCAYKVAYDYTRWVVQEIDYVAKHLEARATSSRSAASPAPRWTPTSTKASTTEIKKYPGIEDRRHRCTATGRRASRRRRWPAILPTLPQIDAVVTQGGDGYGAYRRSRKPGARRR